MGFCWSHAAQKVSVVCCRSRMARKHVGPDSVQDHPVAIAAMHEVMLITGGQASGVVAAEEKKRQEKKERRKHPDARTRFHVHGRGRADVSG